MANTVVKMPQLGESVSEGTIGRWLKQPGDRVERDEPLVEIQTDKVNAEVPSPVAGVLQKILLPEGTTAAVKTDMAIIGDEEVSSTPSSPEAPAPPTFSYDTSASGGVVGHRDEEPTPPVDGEKRFFTPVVLRMAQEHEIDLSTVEGTGAHGRVTRRDVEKVIASRGGRAEPAPSPPPAPAPTPTPIADGQAQPLSPMRRAIAEHMTRARS